VTRLTREQQAVQDALPQYVLQGEIGRGAFGVVYSARHEQLGREVAVKQLPRAFAADPAVRERFVTEARLVASLDHPHIVPVYDFVDRDDGICLIIMERCQRSVSDEFEHRGLATDEACAAVLACCAALEEAHEHGLLHRDIKPENLLYDAKGVVKLADFGIARVRTTEGRRTATGMVIGTPAYMSPEQVRGEELTPASDVYSVGVMAYELLTGTLPFPGATTSTGLLAHHLVTPPTPLLTSRPELPHAVAVVVDRALSKDASARPQSALAFATDLTAACVTAFGEGWIRRRRFVLHWPDVLAVSERPAAHAVRTGTIVVRRATETNDVAAPAAAFAPPATTGASGTVLVPAGAAAPPPPPPPPPPSSAPPSTPPAAAAPPMPPAPAAGTDRDRARTGRLVAAAAAVLVLVVVGIVVATRGGDGGSAGTDTTDVSVDDTTAGSTDDTTDDPADTVADDTAGTTAATGDTVSTAPSTTIDPQFVFERPAGLDFTKVESPFAPTPCPDDQPVHACIWLPLVPDDPGTGDLSVYYFTSGFAPELEPAGLHLHFYLDTAVGGDERKAGSEVSGGTWKEWDGPYPFSTFGGQNGRTGFSMADLQASGARQVCVIVADADQRALPGTGNCAPIVKTWDPAIAKQQVARLTGTYHGGCSIGGSVILPDTWRAVDLVNTPLADAAKELRPTAAAAMQARLEQVVPAGGVLWADGPLIDGFLPSVWMTDVPGEFELSDDPATVASRLGQLGVDIGTTVERTVVDRTLLVGTLIDGGAEGADLVSYVVPDHGHALVVTVRVRDATLDRPFDLADQLVATVNGC
jgi:serine/threonine-protein kinase